MFVCKKPIIVIVISKKLVWCKHVDDHNLHVLPKKMQYLLLMHTCGLAQSSCSPEENAILVSDAYMWNGTIFVFSRNKCHIQFWLIHVDWHIQIFDPLPQCIPFLSPSWILKWIIWVSNTNVTPLYPKCEQTHLVDYVLTKSEINVN